MTYSIFDFLSSSSTGESTSSNNRKINKTKIPIMATTSPLTASQEIKIIKDVIEKREKEKK